MGFMEMDVIEFMILILQIIPIVCGYDFVCPDRSHRKIYSKARCSTPVNYACLKDVIENRYRQTCHESRPVGLGYKYVFRPNFDREICDPSRYQPFLFRRKYHTDCVFFKSKCSEKGQMVDTIGLPSTDVRCKCDEANGYIFVTKPKDSHHCIPSEEDCTCYRINTSIPEEKEKYRSDISIQDEYVNITVTPSKLDNIKDYEPYSRFAAITVVSSFSLGCISIFLMWGYRGKQYKKKAFRVQNKVESRYSSTKDKEMSTSHEEATDKLEVLFDKVGWEVKSDSYDQDEENEFSSDSLEYTVKVESIEKSTSSEEDIKKLKDIYESVEDMVKCEDYDADLQNELSIECPDFMNMLETAKRDLLRNDCGIVVAGETSSGKSTLVNTLVGSVGERPLLKSSILAATAAITRIRNSDELYFKAYTKDEVLIKEERFDNRMALTCALEELTDMEEMPTDMENDLHFLDVYLPVPILKGNIIIVDTPGVGETKTLDTMLIDFLQHAVAFVFVVNCRNAGGVTSDRLGIIINSILENRHKMPCFDTKDVLFLTNQWDSVENDGIQKYSSDSDSPKKKNEVELVWQKVKMKLTDKWTGIPLENIFQVSLKQVQEGTSSKYTEEYKRFETKLHETIAVNKNKRVQFYFNYIQTFHEGAIIGILARLALLEMSEEEHKKSMEENQTKVERLEKYCKDGKERLHECKDKLVEELSEELNKYIKSSTGRDEILNPPGERPIEKVSLRYLNSEICYRLRNGISRWSEKRQSQHILWEADIMIRGQLSYIGSQFKSIEDGLFGVKPVLAVGFSGRPLDLRFASSLIGFPLAIVLPVIVEGILGSVLLVVDLVKSVEFTRKLAEDKYDKCVSKISPNQLKQGFEDSIGKEFSRLINEIYDDVVPKSMKSLRTISRKLKGEYNAIETKRNSIERMKSRIKDIGKKTEEFKTHAIHSK